MGSFVKNTLIGIDLTSLFTLSALFCWWAGADLKMGATLSIETEPMGLFSESNAVFELLSPKKEAAKC